MADLGCGAASARAQTSRTVRTVLNGHSVGFPNAAVAAPAAAVRCKGPAWMIVHLICKIAVGYNEVSAFPGVEEFACFATDRKSVSKVQALSLRTYDE